MTAAAALTAVFLVICLVWLLVDARMPVLDSGRHYAIAYSFADALRELRLTDPLTVYNEYPPLVHLVAAVGLVLVPDSPTAAAFAVDVVFVPLLALGCFGTARIVTGSRLAGLLAVAFALAAPMVISLFHEFMLDAPQTAMVAVSVWLLLRTERFAHVGPSALAGLAVAAGFHTKVTFVLFIAGLVLALLARGGWRNLRGFGVFAGVVLVLVLPWYGLHFDDLSGLTESATSGQAVTVWYGTTPYPSRWSPADFGWYVWATVNRQLYLPLVLFAAVGTVIALVRWGRTRQADSYVPELLAGWLVAFVAITGLWLNDPRYLLPALVYPAVLGTAWIVRLHGRALIAAAGLLLAVLVLNTVMLNTGAGGTARITLPGAKDDPIEQGHAIVASDRGYVHGGSAPHTDGGQEAELTDALEAGRAAGARAVLFEPQSMSAQGWTIAALTVYADIADLKVVGLHGGDPAELLGARDLYVLRGAPDGLPGARPCVSTSDGTAIFLIQGPPPAAGAKTRTVCHR